MTREERAAYRRTHLKVRKIHIHDDHDAFDRERYLAMEPMDRVGIVFALTAHYAFLRGLSGDQLRLQRTVTSIRRGKR